MKRDGYGDWHRPAGYAHINTRNPRRVQLHDRTGFALLAREGQGSYDPYNWETEEPRFRPVRNGVPVGRPYVWRADGWVDRVRALRLDMAAVVAVESECMWEFEARRRKRTQSADRQRPYRDADTRDQVEDLTYLVQVLRVTEAPA